VGASATGVPSDTLIVRPFEYRGRPPIVAACSTGGVIRASEAACGRTRER
jgi:hypothetical protein